MVGVGTGGRVVRIQEWATSTPTALTANDVEATLHQKETRSEPRILLAIIPVITILK